MHNPKFDVAASMLAFAAEKASRTLMDSVIDVSLIIVGFIVILSIVVFVHEMGHFLVARFNKVKVDTFSIGFGPELFGFYDRYGTRWSVSAIPMGGYVKFFGDEDATSATADAEALKELSDEEKAVCFQYKSVFQRFAIVAAGPISNFLLAILIFWGIFMFHGQVRPEARVAWVNAGGPAAEAGLAPNDLIVAVNGEPVVMRQQAQRVIMLAGDDVVNLTIDRDGRTMDVAVTPSSKMVRDSLNNQVKMSRIGVYFARPNDDDLVRLGPLEAMGQASAQTVSLVVDTFRYVGQMITGYRSVDELRGPISIARFSGQALEQGFVGFLMFTALLSANLGLINLFPIPMLDGGHLVFYAYEAVRGKPLNERAQEWLLRFGLAIVLTLMIYTTFNDTKQWLPFTGAGAPARDAEGGAPGE